MKRVFKIAKKQMNAGTLYYTVFVGFVLCVFAVMFIMYLRYQSDYINTLRLKTNSRDNVTSALNYCLHNPKEIPFETDYALELHNEGVDWANIHRTHWGAFQLLKINSGKPHVETKRQYLIGTDFSRKKKIALYVTNDDNYISVSGNTFLRGDVHLPRLGIKAGSILGQRYVSDTLVRGGIYISEYALPLPQESKLQYFAEMLAGNFDEHQTVPFDVVYNDGFLFNSFSDTTLILSSTEDIEIKNNLSVSGNIVIFSPKHIRISADSHIDNVLLFASSIEIESGFKGQAQFFASSSLIIGADVTLQYPSYAGVFNTNRPAELQLGKGSEIEGGVFAYMPAPFGYYPKIDLDENSLIMGNAYCNGAVQAKGAVYGGIWCDKLLLQTSITLFENQLLNTKIDYCALPEHFAGCELTDGTNKMALALWLH